MQDELELIGGSGENPKPTGPDWERFGRAIIEYWPYQTEIPMDELEQWALECRIIKRVPGGFDPDIHVDEEGYAEPGDPWCEHNFQWKEYRDG